MNYLKRPVLVMLVASLFVNSCKNKNCNDPIAFNYDPEGTSADNCVYAPKSVALEVMPVFSGSAFALGDTLTTEDGRLLKFSYFGAYLSNISFKEGEEYKQWTDHVVLVKNGVTDTVTSYLNKSSILALRFDVGVDTAIYKDDPATLPSTNPLGLQVPSMFWTWASGYRFISLEGMVDTSAAKNGTGWTMFAFHTGLPANLHSVELTVPESYSTDSHIDVHLKMDLATVLSGIDFTATPLMIHDGNQPTTIKMMENSVNAFTLD